MDIDKVKDSCPQNKNCPKRKIFSYNIFKLNRKINIYNPMAIRQNAKLHIRLIGPILHRGEYSLKNAGSQSISVF